MAFEPLDDAVRVYWQPGCTSCLRTKEFLTRHGIPFVSRNVLADEQAFAELSRFGLRQVPIVTRRDQWANGQVLADVARLVGVTGLNTRMLPIDELQMRLGQVLEGAERFFGQLPEGQMDAQLPGRPRGHAELAYHVFNIADAFLEEKVGISLVYDSYSRIPEPGAGQRQILAYGADVRQRLMAWFAGPGRQIDWNARADVYYGEQTHHQFLERTTWHCAQHTRQLMWVLENLGVQPERALGRELFEGLPMPEKVWDD